MTNRYEGSCLCGQVKFSVEAFSKKAANCHCSMCRKFHGAAFGTLVEVFGLRWCSGEHLLKEFTSPNGAVRTFCSNCGSSLGFRDKNMLANEIEIAISAFDCDIPVELDAQIYTEYKSNWCELQPGLLTFNEGRET